jgi:hypothetical protein
LALSSVAPLALAQSDKLVVGAAGSVTHVKLYEDDKGTRIKREVAVGALGLPLQVQQEVGDMLLVRLANGESAWLDASEVTVHRKPKDGSVACVKPRSATQPTMVAGSQGASRECR